MGKAMKKRMQEYGAAPNGKDPYVDVYCFAAEQANGTLESKSHASQGDKDTFTPLVSGVGPRPGQRVVYVDGGFDLFSSGHIAFLQTVVASEARLGEERGWNIEKARAQRLEESGEDYPPSYVIAGVHDDEVINRYKGINYPIMNIYERGLCVVQCRYVHAVAFGAPYVPSGAYLRSLPGVQGSLPSRVYHGPTSYMPSPHHPDPYADAKEAGIYQETPHHDFQEVNAAQIVTRILDNRAQYEERQRKKGAKGVGEEAQRKREQMEREAEEERAKMQMEVEKQFAA